MNIFKKVFSIHLSKTILIALLITTAIFSYLYCKGELNDKETVLYGGLVTGLIVAIIQFLLTWNEHLEIENIKALGVTRILPFRDDEAYYRGLIKKANKKIDVLGVTALRFMEDFGDEERSRPEKRVLLDALDKRVKVRILVPNKNNLPQKDHDGFNTSEFYFKKVKIRYPLYFEYGYFDHMPAHSMVIVDDECLLGPVFPHVSSKDTPCIQIKSESVYAKKYLDYFNEEWKNANKPS